MAKRKASGTSRKRASKTAARSKTTGGGAARASSRRKAASRRGAAKRASATSRGTARKPARASKAVKKAVKRAAKKPAKNAAKKKVARRAVGRKATRRTTSSRATRPAARTRPARQTRAGSARSSTPSAAARKAPALSRPRRVAFDDDVLPGPPSSLDLDRSASSSRSGRRELLERFDQHTETGPVVTGGDVDADWESAYSVGDEAPGGDSPTPDQDIVDDIGRAVGVEYQDTEELKGDEKIARRDKHRWELDPASSEDYEDR